MNKNIILLLAVISLVIIVGLFFDFQNQRKKSYLENIEAVLKQQRREKEWNTKQIKIGDKNYEIFVTQTEDEKITGLAAFDDIKDNQGMLFEFPEENYYSFWMKDMKFDIDIIFLDQDKKVIQIFENIQKTSYVDEKNYKTYLPRLKSKYVIEIKSGEVKKNSLQIGNVIIF